VGVEQRSPAPPGFLHAWTQLIDTAPLPTVPRRRGRKPRIPLTQLLPALIFHVMQDAGTLGEHFFELFGEPLADSSWSDRRTRLPWDVFTALMQRVLRPRATRRHAEAFWRGWRLVALDGTQFSLTNTPQIRRRRRKARSRRGRAAFAKLPTAVLVELGLHNPLAAAIGRAGESEWALAQPLLAHLPAGALLLGDRLYGCAAFLTQAWAVCQRVGSHLLVRVRTDLTAEVLARLDDGSRLVRVAVRDADHPHRFVGQRAAGIRVRVGRPGHRAQFPAVDHAAGPGTRAGRGPRAAVRPPLGTRVGLPRAQAGAAEDRPAAKPYRPLPGAHRRTPGNPGQPGAGRRLCRSRSKRP
jgi:hypothetical protein